MYSLAINSYVGSANLTDRMYDPGAQYGKNIKIQAKYYCFCLEMQEETNSTMFFVA